MTYRLAHLSDFHLTHEDEDFDNSIALVDDAIEQQCDHLVITGDLVKSAQMDVVETFIDALDERGWASADRLTIVPGNHDIFPASLSSLRRPTANFETFAELTSASRKGATGRKLVRDEPYPFGKELNKDAVIVGLDTTRRGQYDPRCWAEGELQEHHREAVSDFFLARAKIKHRIVAMHHHPWREEFYESWFEEKLGIRIEKNFTTPPPEEVEDWLRECGATLVLCGHVHAEESIESRRFGRCRVLRSGTAGGVDDEYDDGDKLLIYHLVDLEADRKVRVVKRAFLDSEFSE